MQFQAIKNCVSTFIDVGEVLSYGPFLFVNVNEVFYRHPIFTIIPEVQLLLLLVCQFFLEVVSPISVVKFRY